MIKVKDNITKLTGLNIEYKDNQSTFNPPRMTEDQQKALSNIANPKSTDAKDNVIEGTIIFNTTTKILQVFQGEKWVDIKGNNNNSITTPPNSGITVSTDSDNNTSLGLSFATINPAPNGDIVEFSKIVNINPICPYEMNSSYGFISAEGSGVNEPSTLNEISLIMSGGIVTSQVNSFSSRNIKSILSEEKKDITKEVYELFQKINVVKYEYKDKAKHGKGDYYGVIAEELARDFPHLLQNIDEAVPNIMRKATAKYLSDKSISVVTEITNPWPLEVTQDKQITLFNQNTNSILRLKIDKIYGADQLILSSQDVLPSDIQEVFVYGTEENCPAVNKDQLFEMGLLMIQNLMNTVEDLMQRIQQLETRK